MGKMPLFRSLGLCWVSLALAISTTTGCTTTPSRGKYPPRGTINEQPGFKNPPSSITAPGPGAGQKQPLDPFAGNTNGVNSGPGQYPPPLPMPGTPVTTTHRPPASILPTSGGGFDQAPKALPGALPGQTGPSTGTGTGPYGALEPASKTPIIGSTPPPGGFGVVPPLPPETGSKPANPFGGPGLGAPTNTGGLPPAPPALPGREQPIPGAALPPTPPLPTVTSGYTPGVPTTTMTAPPVGVDPLPPVGVDPLPQQYPGAAGVPLPPISGPQQ